MIVNLLQVGTGLLGLLDPYYITWRDLKEDFERQNKI